MKLDLQGDLKIKSVRQDDDERQDGTGNFKFKVKVKSGTGRSFTHL